MWLSAAAKLLSDPAQLLTIIVSADTITRLPTITKNRDTGRDDAWESLKKGAKRGSNAIIRRGINDLTYKTNRKQSQSEAVKSFRSEGRLENKAKTKRLSRLDLGVGEKTKPIQVTKATALSQQFTAEALGRPPKTRQVWRSLE